MAAIFDFGGHLEFGKIPPCQVGGMQQNNRIFKIIDDRIMKHKTISNIYVGLSFYLFGRHFGFGGHLEFLEN